jgi:hypothetical protein
MSVAIIKNSMVAPQNLKIVLPYVPTNPKMQRIWYQDIKNTRAQSSAALLTIATLGNYPMYLPTDDWRRKRYI